jgi:anti-anti-sigma factor
MKKHFDLTIRTEAGYAVIEPEGYFNEAAGESLAETAKSLMRNGYAQILINFERIRMINSYGIGALLEMSQFLEAHGGVLHLCHLTPTIARVFKMMGLSQHISIFPDEEKAVANFRAQGYNGNPNLISLEQVNSYPEYLRLSMAD